jgi:ribosomal protein L44E
MEKIEKRERFDKEEWVIKSKGICPKCGKNTSIVISHLDKGDKPPKRAMIKVECEDCHYLIDTEGILLSEYSNDDR